MLLSRFIRPRALALALMLCIALPAQAKLKIEITGVEGDALDNVRASLSINKAPDDADAAYLRRLHLLAPQEIEKALRPFGYYQASIEDSLEQDETNWIARYRITPGKPLLVGKVDVELRGMAQNDPPVAGLFDGYPLSQGQHLDQSAHDQQRANVDAQLQRRGYFDANWLKRRIAVDLKRNEADIAFKLDSGVRYVYGDIDITGSQIRDDLVRKHVPMQPGDAFFRDDLLKLHGGLSTQGWFSSVNVQVDRELRDDGTIPITVELTPRPQFGYLGGVGYGTDTGLRGKLGLSAHWLTDRGISADIIANLSERKNGLRSSLRLPSASKRIDHYGLAAAFTDERTDTSTSQSGEIVASRQAPRGPWREVISLTLLDDRFRVGDDRDRTFLVMPGIAWTRVKSDNILFPRRGYALTAQLRGASVDVFSDTSFLQGTISANSIWPAGERGRLILRAQAGGSWVEEFGVLPPRVRYFTGGDRSVRGFGYQSIGPQDDDGDVIGGRHLLVGSAEYEYLFRPRWGIAAFVDSGTAFNQFDESLRTGVGVGLRWHSPVGPIRIDVASAISEEGNPLRLHLTIGPEL